MSKKIIYWTQEYSPEYEAISKEIRDLALNFNGFIYSIRTWGKGKNFFGYDVRKLPLGLVTIPLKEKKFDISHIYASLGNRIFLKLLRKRPIILTAAGPTAKLRIKENLFRYKKLNKIILESEDELNLLLSFGIDDSKLKLILPGIDLQKFKYNKPGEGVFKILFASSPLSKEDSYWRGVHLMTGHEATDSEFILAWRTNRFEPTVKKGLSVKIVKRVYSDMNELYQNVHATVFPALDEMHNKSCPRSVMESLAAGKPVLISEKCGISHVIKEEKCGVVFEPTKEGMLKAIEELKRDYTVFQRNSREIAEKYFSKERFLKEYKEIYESLT